MLPKILCRTEECRFQNITICNPAEYSTFDQFHSSFPSFPSLIFAKFYYRINNHNHQPYKPMPETIIGDGRGASGETAFDLNAILSDLPDVTPPTTTEVVINATESQFNAITTPQRPIQSSVFELVPVVGKRVP